MVGAEGGNATRLTSFGGARLETPRWSPDGRRLVFSARVPARADLYTVSAEGGVPDACDVRIVRRARSALVARRPLDLLRLAPGRLLAGLEARRRVGKDRARHAAGRIRGGRVPRRPLALLHARRRVGHLATPARRRPRSRGRAGHRPSRPGGLGQLGGRVGRHLSAAGAPRRGARLGRVSRRGRGGAGRDRTAHRRGLVRDRRLAGRRLVRLRARRPPHLRHPRDREPGLEESGHRIIGSSGHRIIGSARRGVRRSPRDGSGARAGAFRSRRRSRWRRRVPRAAPASRRIRRGAAPTRTVCTSTAGISDSASTG